MTLTASGIITSARDTHMAFDLKHTPLAPALRFLSRYVRELHGKVLAIDEDALRVEGTATLPLADHDAGIALPTGLVKLIDVQAREPETTADRRWIEIPLIDPAHRHDYQSYPSRVAWQIGATLYLRSPANLWTYYGEIGYGYVVVPGTLTADTATIPLPDESEGCLVDAVADFMAQRTAGREDVDRRYFRERAAESEAEFLTHVQNRHAGLAFQTRDVWP